MKNIGYMLMNTVEYNIKKGLFLMLTEKVQYFQNNYWDIDNTIN